MISAFVRTKHYLAQVITISCDGIMTDFSVIKIVTIDYAECMADRIEIRLTALKIDP